MDTSRLADPNREMDATHASSRSKLGRFTLRELFFLTGLICLVGGSYAWIAQRSSNAGIISFIAAAVVAMAFAIHILTRWPLAIIFIGTPLLAFVALGIPAMIDSRHAARRASCSNNLHNIALALQQYADNHGSYPPPYITDSSGKPMHSWRVLLLPYLDQKALYDQYRFDEPWDGPNNVKLHGTVLKIYSCPADSPELRTTNTSYTVVIGPNTVFPETSKHPIRSADIIDGLSNTILLVEVHSSGIHWMEPRDLHIDRIAPAINPPRGQGISSHHAGGANVAFADGSVRCLGNDTTPMTLRAMLTRNGKEPVPGPSY